MSGFSHKILSITTKMIFAIEIKANPKVSLKNGNLCRNKWMMFVLLG
jgi:hypothetical protein